LIHSGCGLYQVPSAWSRTPDFTQKLYCKYVIIVDAPIKYTYVHNFSSNLKVWTIVFTSIRKHEFGPKL
jgi:hypothetical protein